VFSGFIFFAQFFIYGEKFLFFLPYFSICFSTFVLSLQFFIVKFVQKYSRILYNYTKVASNSTFYHKALDLLVNLCYNEYRNKDRGQAKDNNRR